MCWSPSRLGALALVALLAGCGNLPRPFAGNPGTTGLRLSQPPPARLAVPLPTDALLTDAADMAYRNELVEALQAQEVPAVADVARTGDWCLTIAAEVRGDKVVPVFSVQSPDGKQRGTTDGVAMDAAQWAEASAPTLQHAANTGAPAVAALLTRIEAELRLSDPNSLVNRPARIFVPEVTGAPGDGNHQLARNLRQQMPEMGEQVRDSPREADFTVQGEVKTAAGAAGTERIEIQWIVSDAQGREAGRVVQLNEVSPGSLDRYWGDTALAVAQEAASGIRDVIQNQLGARAAGAKPRPDTTGTK